MSKEHIIEIDTRSSDYWIHLLENNRRSLINKDIQNLIIDFGRTRFLEPFNIVSLACLIEEYAQEGIQISFRMGTYNINKYLHNIRFCEYWNKGFDRNKYTKINIDTTLCLWKVRNTMIDSYATEAQKYFQNSYFQGKNLESLYLSLTEVFNNIFDHSQSGVDGYVLTQCYPRIDKIVVSICDFGVGIPTKINEIWELNNKDRLSDEDALRAAFFRHITSKSTPRNRGFGLATLFDIVKNLNGELTAVSNNGVLKRLSNGIITTYPPNILFQGTLIIVTLDKRYLPDIENEIDNEEFIF